MAFTGAAAARRTAVLCTYASATPPLSDVRFRRGSTSDNSTIRRLVLNERMNPLNLQPERFLVAVDGSNNSILGFGQLQPVGNNSNGLLELRTLIVDPPHRGRGVGSALVRQLVNEAHSPDSTRDVYLTTLASTAAFYEAAGFAVVNDPSQYPRELWFEVAAGTVLAFLVARQKLIVMRHIAPQQMM